MKTSNHTAFRHAVRAANNIGAPGTGASFVRALQEAFPAEPSTTHGPCAECGGHTHKSVLTRHGMCMRCYHG